MKLSEICEREKYIITKINAQGNRLYTLWDLGITEGSEVEMIGRSPLKDPCAYLVKDTVLALRKRDAQLIEVELK